MAGTYPSSRIANLPLSSHRDDGQVEKLAD
jgi:hypothetical protein